MTDVGSYSFGLTFVSHLNYLTREQGGLLPFVRFLMKKYDGRPLSITEFIGELSQFYRMDFEPLFRDKVICDKRGF